MTGLEPAVIAQIAGTAISAVGAIQQGNAAKSAANFNAAVAARNAQISRDKATADAARQEREARLRAGANRAAVGGMGVTLEGSPLDVLESNAAQEELDRLSILHAGEIQASGFETEAQLETMRGKQAQKAGYVGAAGTLLMGGAKVASSPGFSNPFALDLGSLGTN